MSLSTTTEGDTMTTKTEELLTTRRAEISDTTGFDHGDRFADDARVRAYFTQQSMREMFDSTGGLTQDELDAMADDVIEHGWHMIGEAEQDGATVTVHTGRYGARDITTFDAEPEHLEDPDDFGPNGETWRVIVSATTQSVQAGGAITNENTDVDPEPIWETECVSPAALHAIAVESAGLLAELREIQRQERTDA